MDETWKQILTIIVANFAIIWWFRKESREDWVRCQNTIDSIKDEMKDFHERLLKIEMDRK
jgi:hypothetical protein